MRKVPLRWKRPFQALDDAMMPGNEGRRHPNVKPQFDSDIGSLEVDHAANAWVA
jgi:hypothetical protein